MKRILIAAGVLLLLASSARAQTSPTCAQLPNLICATTAGDTVSGTLTFDDNVTSPFIFEGATDDTNETTVNITDPTADRTLTIPNADTATAQAIDCSAGQHVDSFNATTGAFACTDDSGGTTLAGLTDTNISGPSGGDLLIWDGTDSWDNQTVSGDITISSSGVVTLADNSVSGDKIAMGSDATGDILYYSAGGDYTRLPIGSSDEVLRVTGGLPDWQAIGDLIGPGDLSGVLTWNENWCLDGACTAADVPCDCCTGSGTGTCGASSVTLANAPRDSSCDTWGASQTIQVWSNGLMQKCVAASPGVNEFTISGSTLGLNSASSVVYVTYER